MTREIAALYEALEKVQGYIYPNELELQWSLLIVLYPYITGLVAGAFILASLERVFNVKEVKPTYRLSLLTALAFLLAAPLSLNAHLGHPLRGYEIFVTPNTRSAMAMFGFVYLWYLMVVLLVEIWLDYRREIIATAKKSTGLKHWIYRILSLGVLDASERSFEIDERVGRILTVIGIPSAVLLHGYVGFIFGSVKANPWWSTPLMPVIFIFSAMVSGIAMVLLLYMILCMLRKVQIDMPCVDTVAKYLFYAMVVAVSLEALEIVQKTYEAEEHFDILMLLVQGRLYLSFFVVQILIGVIFPFITLGLIQIVTFTEFARKVFYVLSSLAVLIGVLAMRWNVVIGGQFFSKSLWGFTTYKIGLIGMEGILVALAIFALPFGILAALIKFLPPWPHKEA